LVRDYKISVRKALKLKWLEHVMYSNLKKALNLNNFTDQNSAEHNRKLNNPSVSSNSRPRSKMLLETKSVTLSTVPNNSTQ